MSVPVKSGAGLPISTANVEAAKLKAANSASIFFIKCNKCSLYHLDDGAKFVSVGYGWELYTIIYPVSNRNGVRRFAVYKSLMSAGEIYSRPAKKGVSKKRVFNTLIKTPGLEVLWVLKNMPTLNRGKAWLKGREIEGGKG